MTTLPANLAGDLAVIVAAVPGVQALYSTRPALLASAAAVVGKTVEFLTPASGGRQFDAPDAATAEVVPPQTVRVDATDDGIGVDVRIGVSDVESAADICRRVHDGIFQHLLHNDLGEGAAITVTVARIG